MFRAQDNSVGYNICDGGEGGGKPSETSRKKQSDALKGKPWSAARRKANNRKPWSEEARVRAGMSAKARGLSDAFLATRGNRKGKRWSEAHKAALSVKAKARGVSGAIGRKGEPWTAARRAAQNTRNL
jgi:hypothetical protein